VNGAALWINELRLAQILGLHAVNRALPITHVLASLHPRCALPMVVYVRRAGAPVRNCFGASRSWFIAHGHAAPIGYEYSRRRGPDKKRDKRGGEAFIRLVAPLHAAMHCDSRDPQLHTYLASLSERDEYISRIALLRVCPEFRADWQWMKDTDTLRVRVARMRRCWRSYGERRISKLRRWRAILPRALGLAINPSRAALYARPGTCARARLPPTP